MDVITIKRVVFSANDLEIIRNLNIPDGSNLHDLNTNVRNEALRIIDAQLKWVLSWPLENREQLDGIPLDQVEIRCPFLLLERPPFTFYNKGVVEGGD